MLRYFCTIAAFILVFLFQLTGCAPMIGGNNAPKALTFLISSNTVSEYTPCGCHSGRWGGMPRRGTLFAEVMKNAKWPVLIVDTGNVSQGSTNEMGLKKTHFIFQAYKVIGYDAVNVGMSDLRLGLDILRKEGVEQNIPWLSCNTFAEGVMPKFPSEVPQTETPKPEDRPLVPKFQPDSKGGESPHKLGPSSGNAEPAYLQPSGASPNPQNPQESRQAEAKPKETGKLFNGYVVVEKPEFAPGYKIGIIGAMVQDGPRLNTITGYSFQPYNEAILEQIQELKSKKKADFIVLLCDSDANDLKDQLSEEVKAGLDLVIGGRMRADQSPNASQNPLNKLYQRPPANAADSSNKMQQSQGGSKDNSSASQSAENPLNNLPEITKPLIIPKASTRGRYITQLDVFLNDKGRIVDYQWEEIPVDEKFEDDPRMAEISRAYDTEILSSELNAKIGRIYSGSEACYTCHPGFRAVWQNHRHFKTYQRIVDENKLDDAKCTMCHAIGFTEEPRLLTYDLIDEKLRNVGCEGCHPSGERHINLWQDLLKRPPEQRANAATADPMSNVILPETCTACHSGKFGVGFDPGAAIKAAAELCKSVKNPTVPPPQE